MAPLTLFSFGYFGWGNRTSRLVELVDAVERARGFAPPLFVDTRIRRSVRAAGFNGSAFANLLGPERHRWMKALGNRHILTRQGPAIQIDQPAAAAELLDLAATAAADGRRLLFFCGCPWPREAGELACHRAEIGRLVVASARQKHRPAAVVEWPGGTPASYTFDLPPAQARTAASRKYVPLADAPDLALVGGIPWGSRAEFRAPAGSFVRLVGPAVWQGKTWALPVLAELDADDAGWHAQAAALRRAFGLAPVEPTVV